jgi:hypothetical protein
VAITWRLESEETSFSCMAVVYSRELEAVTVGSRVGFCNDPHDAPFRANHAIPAGTLPAHWIEDCNYPR